MLKTIGKVLKVKQYSSAIDSFVLSCCFWTYTLEILFCMLHDLLSFNSCSLFCFLNLTKTTYIHKKSFSNQGVNDGGKTTMTTFDSRSMRSLELNSPGK